MDINQKESVNKSKPSLSVINVQSFNEIEIPTAQNLNVFLGEFISESDDYPGHEDGKSENKSGINGIINRSEVEPEASSNEHGINLGPSSNNDDGDEETREVGAAPEMEMDDIQSICSSSSTASYMKDSFATNETIFDGTLFSLNKVTHWKEWIAKCNLCKPSKEFRGGLTISTNFQTHLKRNHGDLIADLVLKQISKKARLEEHNYGIRHIQNNSPQPPSPSAIYPLDKQIPINTNIFNYFLKSFIPLNGVELPEFWAMFNHHSNAKMPRINKEDLTKQIRIKFEMIKNKIISLLEGVDFVCTATDCWPSEYHFYIAITCHWIDAGTFKRRSVTLACKRFDSFLDGLQSQVLLIETLKNYNLPIEKVTSNATQNFYNFCKLFKDLNIPTIHSMPYPDTINDNNVVSFQTTRELKPYISYSKKLSLIATIDVPNAINMKHTMRNIHYSTLTKVFSFLFLATSNTTLAPMLADFKKPVVGKWNSIYDSLAYFLKLEESRSLNDMCELLKIEQFTAHELIYLREYVKCVRPLALAFERLQCEQGSLHGFVLPTLIELRKNCDKLEEKKNIALCNPIVRTIRSTTKKRFDKFFNVNHQSERVIIASVSHPFLKDKWVPAIEEFHKDRVRAMFIQTVKNENPKSNEVQEEDKYEEQMADFYFGDEYPKYHSKEKHSVQQEVLRYLDDDRRNLKILNEYPAVKRVFLKYNTPLASSEPVEKICPFETRQIISKYGCLVEEFFEERVLVFLNKDFLDS